MHKVLLPMFLLIFAFTVQAQDKTGIKYQDFTSKADGLYKQGLYKAAAKQFEKAFKYKEYRKARDLYNAACLWSLANNPEKAFEHLSSAVVNEKYSDYSHLISDKDFLPLHGDKRWISVLDQVKQNELQKNKWAAILDPILELDQKYRGVIDSIKNNFGMESPQMKANLTAMRKADSINLIQVEAIIDSVGWLGAQEAGNAGNLVIFLVIQHSDSRTQEKYLPLMRTAAKKGKARLSDLALLEDRVLVSNGKKQLYGSQVGIEEATGKYSFAPIENEEKLNERRKAMGLQPIEEYAKFFDIDYKSSYSKKAN